MASSVEENHASTEVKRKSLFAIDAHMVPSKIMYFIWGGILGTSFPFYNVFFTSIGLSATQAGFISGIRYVATSVAGPMWGALADHTGRRKLILIILCLGAAFPLFSMPWVATAIYNPPKNNTCLQHGNSSANGTLDSREVCWDSTDEDGRNVLFYVMVAIMIVGSLFAIPLSGYVDIIIMNVTKTAPRKPSFGRQRIFGSIGFIASNFIASFAADHYQPAGMSNYTAIFYFNLPCVLLIMPIGTFVLGQANWECKTPNDVENDATSEDPTNKRKVLIQVCSLFKKFDFIFFLVTALISGVAFNIFTNFCLLLLSDEFNVSKTKMSLVLIASSISSMFMLPFTGKVIKTLGGSIPTITLGIFCYFIRFMVMSYTTKYWIMVAVQTIHSFCFASTWVAMMEHIHRITPVDVLVTMQFILQSVHFGISSLIANILGGYLYHIFGGRLLYRGEAVLCGLWSLLMIAYYGSKHLKNRRIQNNMKVTYKDNEVGIDNRANDIDDVKAPNDIDDVIAPNERRETGVEICNNYIDDVIAPNEKREAEVEICNNDINDVIVPNEKREIDVEIFNNDINIGSGVTAKK